jgi:hypothetical protein
MICIVSSLSENERRPADFLYSELIGSPDRPDFFKIKHFAVNSKNEFIKSLNTIYHFAENGEYPILHFEMHGNEDGLSLVSGQYISWDELKDHITKINVAIKNNLLITLATCRGAYLMSVITLQERSPFGAMIGSWVDIQEIELVSFVYFYLHLIRYKDLNMAYANFKLREPEIQRRFYFINSEHTFLQFYNSYVHTHHDTIDTWERFKSLNQTAGNSHSLFEGIRFIALQKQSRRAKYREFRDNYFMIDLYPELEEIYGHSWEEMMSHSFPFIEDLNVEH